MSLLFSDPALFRRWTIRLALTWVVLLYARTAWVSASEMDAGLVARAASDDVRAIAHFRRALKHHAPPFDRGSAAIDELVAIASAAERRNDTETALSAWRSIRAGCLSGRWLLVPHGDALARADRRIAELSERNDAASTRSRAVALRVARSLDESPREHLYGIVLTLGGFFSFVFASYRLVSRDLTIDDSYVPAEAKRSLLVALVSFVVFVVGLFAT